MGANPLVLISGVVDFGELYASVSFPAAENRQILVGWTYEDEEGVGFLIKPVTDNPAQPLSLGPARVSAWIPRRARPFPVSPDVTSLCEGEC